MSIFLISLSGPSVAATDWSIDDAGRQLVNAGVDVVREWTTPDPHPDYLVVRAAALGALEDAAERITMPMGWIAELTLAGELEPPDQALIAALPQEAPPSLLGPDVVAFMPQPLEWCEKCHDFRRRGHRHSR